MGKYIHYGSKCFDPDRWIPIKNCQFIKPRGGFWASPVDANMGWYKWCKENKFHESDLRDSFDFELLPFARILELTPENVSELPSDRNWVFGDMRELGDIRFDIDFEALSRYYDVLECSISKYPDLYWKLYGWDCDSILIMNPEVIVV